MTADACARCGQKFRDGESRRAGYVGEEHWTAVICTARLREENAALREALSNHRRSELWRRSELGDLDDAEKAELAALEAEFRAESPHEGEGR